MKKIGNTDNNGILLECSFKEYENLMALVEVVRGRSFPLYPVGYDMDQNLEPLFCAIREWVMIKERANALRNMACVIENAIGVKVDGK